MTLPFRGRHHDDESAHDRARALTSAEMLAPLGEDESAWLARHLEACAECRRDREAYLADRQLLRSLRDRPVEPPRDLWARTSAAIDREAGRSRRRRAVTSSGRAAARDLWRGLPLGAAAGALVVLVVVGSSLIPRPVPPASPPGSLPVAVGSPQPTPMAIPAADSVAWIRPGANGRWELVISDVEEVCPRPRQGCNDLGEDDPGQSLDLGGTPTGLAISPTNDQLVVESTGDGSTPGSVFVLPLPSAPTGGTPAPATPAPETPAVTAGPSDGNPSPPPSIPIGPSATPGSTPEGAIEIASGVTMVGEAAYSADGVWLAFSARPADGSTGPDLYLWHVGDPSALAVTADHQTYFSGWLDGAILASRVDVPAPTEPEASSDPGATPDASPAATGDSTHQPSPAPLPAHPTSFLLDPATLARTDLTQPDVWLPVVDPAGRLTAYWSGTLLPTADGLGWRLADGRLVLDRWVPAGDVPAATPGTSDAPTAPGEPTPSGEPASPDGSDAPPVRIGPAGEPFTLDVGRLAVFQAKFDPEGVRLAVWTADEPDATVGRLHLVVLDPESGTVDASIAPLPGAPALRRFSIDNGRLAWVSPRGQDGRESAVQVLGWLGRDFGEIQTIPAKDLFIVR